jgi:membrane-bound serine protease (ClpP class)
LSFDRGHPTLIAMSLRTIARRTLAVLCCATWTCLAIAQQRDAARGAAQVIVVPIHDTIGLTTVALIQRAMRMAVDTGATRIVLDIDTPGGRVDAMREIEVILAALKRASGSERGAGAGGGAQIVAFVRRQALSAGGYLALACDTTFMAPGATLGAITPVEVGPMGMQQIQDSDVRRKLLSAMRSDVRSLVQRRATSSKDMEKLAEAMVDPTMRVFEVTWIDKDGFEVTGVRDSDGIASLEASGRRTIRQSEIGRTPLTLTADEALRWGFSSGTKPSLDALVREEFLLPPDSVVQLDESWSESAVAWLETMKPLLFVIGFILLLVEVKVPGLIVPGVLGVLLLGLGLFSSYLVGLAEWTEILLFFLGLAAIAVEIFVLPGTIVFGLIGFLCVVFALVLSQQTFIVPGSDAQQDILVTNLLNLLWLVLLVTGGAALFYKVLPRLPFFNRSLLIPPDQPMTGDSTRFARDDPRSIRTQMIGRTGTAATDLRPAGILEVDGRRFDVVTAGAFIDRGSAVRVVSIDGNRIVVELADGSGSSGEASIGLLFLLVVIGLGLILAEVFFVSFGILSVGAAVSLVSAIFLAFTQHGQGMGFLVLTLAAVGTPLCIAFALRVLPRTAIGRSLILSGPSRADVTGAAGERGLEALLHQRGEALSDLRPSGFARINGKRVDVVTRGEMLEQHTPIKVLLVEGNRVVVGLDPDHTASTQ